MEQLKPFTEKRPWGEFRTFILNQEATVKIITVNRGESFSLQKHSSRNEFWRILSGVPELTIGDKTFLANVEDEFEIPAGTIHRVSAPNDRVEILEISTGYFDEEDIMRIEDKYGRI